MPDFSVPRWLEPPNEMEKARIDEATRAAQEKAGMMIKRQMGIYRMQQDVAEATQNGVDPVTAKQNALFNNAHLLFSDHPEAVDRLVDSEAANRSRDRALQQAQARLALTEKHYSDLAIQAKERLAQTKAYQDKKLEQGNREYAPSIVGLDDPVTGRKVSVFRKSPTTSELVEGKNSTKKPALGEVDKQELRSIYKRIDAIQSAHDALEPERGDVKDHPNTVKRMQYSLMIRQLRDKAKALEAKASASEGDEEAPAPVAAPAPAPKKKNANDPLGLFE